MNQQALFITPAEIVKFTPIGGNVDTDRYIYIIYEQQRYLIEDIIGTALYEKIATDILAATPLTGLYETLHENYLKPILYNAVFSEYVLTGQYNVQDSGIFKALPTNSESAPIDEVRFFANNYKAKADVWVGRLQKWLCDVGVQIPEYQEDQPNDFDQHPNRDVNIVGGFYLPGRISKTWYNEDISR